MAGRLAPSWHLWCAFVLGRLGGLRVFFMAVNAAIMVPILFLHPQRRAPLSCARRPPAFYSHLVVATHQPCSPPPILRKSWCTSPACRRRSACAAVGLRQWWCPLQWWCLRQRRCGCVCGSGGGIVCGKWRWRLRRWWCLWQRRPQWWVVTMVHQGWDNQRWLPADLGPMLSWPYMRLHLASASQLHTWRLFAEKRHPTPTILCIQWRDAMRLPRRPSECHHDFKWDLQIPLRQAPPKTPATASYGAVMARATLLSCTQFTQRLTTCHTHNNPKRRPNPNTTYEHPKHQSHAAADSIDRCTVACRSTARANNA